MTALQLRRWRDRLGLTQDRAADALGINLRTYKRWEKDGPPFPKLTKHACNDIEQAGT